MEQLPRNGGNLRVVVVGAGKVGASIAYHLSQRGVSLTLVDQGEPGHGASSHSFAWINAGAKSPASYHDFNRRSLEMWGRFAHQLGVHSEGRQRAGGAGMSASELGVSLASNR